MKTSMISDLPEMISTGVVDQNTAQQIQTYYENKKQSSGNRLFIVFGILGATLVGMGIILILAHNWDDLSRGIKTAFSFLPLLVGQFFCGYVLLKKTTSTAWKESASAFLFMAVGASIALIGQVYNIPGNTASFLLTWSIICLPLVYVMKSSFVSLLYIIAITYYPFETQFWSYASYCVLLAGIIPHYYQLYKQHKTSNFMVFHNWIIPISIAITLITASNHAEELLFISYFSLFGLFYLIGEMDFFTHQKSRNNGFRIIGSIGTLVLLYVMSFDWIWEELRMHSYSLNELIAAPEFIVTVILTLLAGSFLFQKLKNKKQQNTKPMSFVFVLFTLIFISGVNPTIAVFIINLCILALGILTIWNGAKENHLGVMNFGLLIITVLVTCRFFDTNLSFVLRGMMFLIVGLGFFTLNYYLLKKRNKNEQK